MEKTGLILKLGQKKEKTIIRRKKVWKRIVEFGALLGFILTAIHLYEMFIVNKK